MSNRFHILFSYAFRPFFLLASVLAILVIAIWMLFLNGIDMQHPGGDPTNWHGHEMIVGFALAVVGGFVLSAVATWTGRPAVNGTQLAWLVVTWLLGRIAMFMAAAIPDATVLMLDMLFPLSLCYFVAREIFGARNKRNYKIVAIILLIAAANLAFHLLNASQSVYALIHTMLLLVALIGGRIVPSFTANWLRGREAEILPSNNLTLDGMAITLTILVGIAVVFFPNDTPVAYLAFAAAMLHAVRVSQWCGMKTIRNPMLLILHVAYWWLPIGYLMMGLAHSGYMFTPTIALHALTMGAIGSMVIAMMTRVPLGHTGRPLHASRVIVAAYIVLTLAIIIRIVSPWADSFYLEVVYLAAVGWCLAFALFIWVYWPILLGPPINKKAPK